MFTTKKITVVLAEILILSFLVLGVSGCMFSKKNVNDLAVDYMTKKYGEEFTYSGAFGTDYATPGIHKLLVKCASFDGDILVQAEKDGKGNWTVFSDNYIAHKYKDEMKTTLRELASACWAEVKVVYSVETRTLNPQLPADADFDTYVRDAGTLTYASVVVPSSDPLDPQIVDGFARQLSQRVPNGDVWLVALTPNDYKRIDEETTSWISGADGYRYRANIHIREGVARVNQKEAD